MFANFAQTPQVVATTDLPLYDIARQAAASMT
jgi:hypothetical protein